MLLRLKLLLELPQVVGCAAFYIAAMAPGVVSATAAVVTMAVSCGLWVYQPGLTVYDNLDHSAKFSHTEATLRWEEQIGTEIIPTYIGDIQKVQFKKVKQNDLTHIMLTEQN